MSTRDRREHITKELGYKLGKRFSTAVVLFHSAVAERLGLNVTDWKCASILFEEGPCNPSRLSALTGMSSAATTQVIDRLERAGIVRRERDPDDRRKVVIHPVSSPVLAEALPQIFAGLGRAMTAVMSGYDYEQLATILDFVERSSEVLEEQARRLRREASPARSGRRRQEDRASTARASTEGPLRAPWPPEEASTDS